MTGRRHKMQIDTFFKDKLNLKFIYYKGDGRHFKCGLQIVCAAVSCDLFSL